MKLPIKILLLVLAVFIQTGWATPKQKPVQIAFLSDVHLQDIYGTLSDTPFKGILNPVNGKMATIRTMKSQLNSTRLFNENYFAFLAALDDLGHRGVKLIALPGDFSDDGQPINVEGLRRILSDYQQKYDMRFFITCGNHDPELPFAHDGGKSNFLGVDGREQPIMSKADLFATSPDALPAAISPSVKLLGYAEISEILSDYGFYPQPEYHYWETPFSSYRSIADYNFLKAQAEASLGNRQSIFQLHNRHIPDVSYLVEPIEGLWLLAIDANVYVPLENGTADNDNAVNYAESGIGYNQVLEHKKYLCKWVADVAQRAREQGKILIAFSHYPMVEFNNGSTPLITELAGKNKMQTARIPGEDVARFFADAGIRIHFAGHMHLNNTGLYRSPSGNVLCNVQIPSLAAYRPGYKLLTISDGLYHVETVNIDSVPRFDELFPLYETEYDYLAKKGDKDLWNHDILKAKNYRDFARSHLRELVRLRFIPGEWPSDFTRRFCAMNWRELLRLLELSPEGMKSEDFEIWTGYDFLLDLYALYNANELALNDIFPLRLKQYRWLVKKVAKTDVSLSGKLDFKRQVCCTVAIMGRLLSTQPNARFSFHPQTGELLHEDN